MRGRKDTKQKENVWSRRGGVGRRPALPRERGQSSGHVSGEREHVCVCVWRRQEMEKGEKNLEEARSGAQRGRVGDQIHGECKKCDLGQSTAHVHDCKLVYLLQCKLCKTKNRSRFWSFVRLVTSAVPAPPEMALKTSNKPITVMKA